MLPALLAGNAVVLRHATSPHVGEHFAKCFGKLHLGAHTKTESDTTSQLLVHMHTSIATHDWLGTHCDAIAHRIFTGSTAAGRNIYEALGQRAKNTDLRQPFIAASLELGGNDAAYVHNDAVIAPACEFIAVVGRLHNTGQSCCSTKRLLVHSEVYQIVCERMATHFAAVTAGDPTDSATTLGRCFARCRQSVLVLLSSLTVL